MLQRRLSSPPLLTSYQQRVAASRPVAGVGGLGAAVARGGGGTGFAGRGGFSSVFGFPGAFSFNGFRTGNPFFLNFPFQTPWPNTWYPYYPQAYLGATCPIGTINLTAEQTRVLQAGQALTIVALDTCGNRVQVTLHGTPGAGLTVSTSLAGDDAGTHGLAGCPPVPPCCCR